MKKTTLIIVVVLVLLILGGGAFYFLGKSSNNPLQSAADKMTQMTTQKKSLLDMFTMAGNLKCTFSDKTNSSSGTVFVSNGKIRGDFQSVDGGKNTASHMINDGQYIYIWTDGVKEGYKTTVATIKDMTSPTGAGTSPSQASSDNVNFHQQANYSCDPWSVDASQFVLPQGVTFTDYSAMMQKMQVTQPPQGMTTQQQQSECSQCDQVPAGAMRNQCRAALKCQ